MSDPESIKQLADELHREDLEDARQMQLIDKLLAGPRIFERSCWLMAIGFRNQYPDASEDEIQGLIDEQLERLRKLESVR